MSDVFGELSKIIVQTIPDPWLTLDAELRVVAANQSFYQAFHATSQEIEHHFIYELDEGQWNIPALHAALEQVLLKGLPVDHLEVSHDFAGIGQRTLLINARRINNERAGTPTILLFFEDITERKRSEQELRAKDLRFQALIENCLDGILLSNVDGTMFYLSPAATRIIGYTVEEIVNKNRFDLIHPDDLAECRAAWADILQQPGKALSHEYRLRHRDGSWLWIECVSCNKLADPDVGAVIGNYRDTSEHKKMEAEMINSEMLRLEIENEKEIIKLKENFISQVSHDFRTPLSVIQASSDLLGRYFEQIPPSKRVKFLRDIQVQIKYMVDLLDNVMTADRAHSGRFKPELAPLDVMAFCREIAEQLQLTDRGEHHLVFVTEGNIQDSRTDENLLRRILDNLLSNATKYSPHGSEILFAVTAHNDEFVFQVTDHGIGIPAQDQKHLFDEFHRASNTGNISGTGLGLAIVKSNVEALGGTITCDSKEGEGTTFWVRLPANV